MIEVQNEIHRVLIKYSELVYSLFARRQLKSVVLHQSNKME